MHSRSSTPWIQSLLSTSAYTMFVGVACAVGFGKLRRRLPDAGLMLLSAANAFVQQPRREAYQGLGKKVHKTPELVHADPIVMVDIQHINHVLAVFDAD